MRFYPPFLITAFLSITAATTAMELGELLPTVDNSTQLYLSPSSKVRDLRPVAGFRKFDTVLISGTQVSDLAPIRGFTNLQHLNCDRTPVSDITPLSRSIKLLYISLMNTRVRDLTPLSELINLSNLYLDYTGVSDLMPLFRLKNLTDLSINNIAATSEEKVLELSRALPKCRIVYNPKMYKNGRVERVFDGNGWKVPT